LSNERKNEGDERHVNPFLMFSAWPGNVKVAIVVGLLGWQLAEGYYLK